MGAPLRKAVRRALAMPSILCARLLGALPLPTARRCGRGLGRVAYRLVPRIRRVGMANLDLAFGDSISQAEKVRILVGAAENVGVVAAEFARIGRLRDALLDQVEVAGGSGLDPSRGALLVSAHLGNWEWMAPALAARGLRVAEIVRPLDDPWLDGFVDRTRRAGGILTLPKENAGADMLRLLREGWCVGVLADQSPRTSAVPVTYFGRRCWATVAPVMAALRARVPVHPVCMWRRPDGRYLLEIRPSLPMARTRDFRLDMVENSQRVQDALESMVRDHPDQWLWLHRRWKPRPRLEAEWARRDSATEPAPATPD